MHNKAPRIPPIEISDPSPALTGPLCGADIQQLPKRDAIILAGARVFMEQGFE